MIRILSSPVTLKTEEELLVSRSKIAGRGSTDPLAMQFCDRFTKDYQAIAEQRTVYRELENMFRWVALAQIMKQQNAPEQSGMSLDYFLSQCEVVRPEISSSLPGIASVHRVETKRNSTTLYHWSMTVGGVDMNIVIRGEDVKPDADGSVRKLEQSALAARPSRSALCWVFM
jgi:hypothetical protein